MTRKKQALRVLGALAVGGGLALLSPSLPAVGQISPPAVVSVELLDEASLVARGAAVDAQVEVQCPAGSPASVSVQLVQRAGSKIATGFGGTSGVVCTGGTQIVTVQVFAQPGQAFKKGPAVGQASLSTCGFAGCAFVNDSENIDIVR